MEPTRIGSIADQAGELATGATPDVKAFQLAGLPAASAKLIEQVVLALLDHHQVGG